MLLVDSLIRNNQLSEEDIKKYGEKYVKKLFTDIENNLNAIDLSKSNIYVQNLCRNYFFEETGKYFNKRKFYRKLIYKKDNYSNIEWAKIVQNEYNDNEWIKVALEWVDLLIEELSKVDPKNELPVLVTSQYLLLPLINAGYEDVINKAGFYYSDKSFIENGFIKKEKNRLQRTIIPLFRHYRCILNEEVMEKRMKSDSKNKEMFKKRNRIYRDSLFNFINRGK